VHLYGEKTWFSVLLNKEADRTPQFIYDHNYTLLFFFEKKHVPVDIAHLIQFNVKLQLEGPY